MVSQVPKAGLHPTDEDLSVHPNEQKPLAGDPESVGTPGLGTRSGAIENFS